jgi:hypothetical protein
MQALDDAGIADDTIVVFTSDHGDMLGSQGRFRKRLPWEESSHVPLIIRYPRQIGPDQRSDILFNSVDIMPTLLGLCDASVPEGVQGLDLSGLILGEDEMPPDAVYLELLTKSSGANSDVGNWRAIRTHDWLYARHEGFTGGWLFYDMNEDPHQMENLIRDGGVKPIRKELDARLTDWVNSTTKPHAVEKQSQSMGESGMNSNGKTPPNIRPELMQNYPNPSNPGTWIPYQLDRARKVEIYIHDSAGGLQRKLDLGAKPAGTYTSKQNAAYWDGRNQFGEVVATGIYFYTLRAGDFSAARKMIVMH